MKIRNFLVLPISLLSFICITDAIAIPPERIVKRSSNLQVEVNQVSVLFVAE
ncbi:hypothetical protein IQ249_21980 [Lusitaniella coriacea LEGE 07157]|uniref:Uncharacterized protein n=1 Tax=Lusitaniella coriacea LEGE 07157 TaxID=945747 RepID=A0A8J7IX81_9CYAN|nr:hypothetical protein [Lusitaniella coriacea]MBE9118562.1 hypothetical protein [Lusitaniella coriacea LEGE 07157]